MGIRERERVHVRVRGRATGVYVRGWRLMSGSQGDVVCV
jgi:hypothetical protein